jgi:hypothetical protein
VNAESLQSLGGGVHHHAFPLRSGLPDILTMTLVVNRNPTNFWMAQSAA